MTEGEWTRCQDVAPMLQLLQKLPGFRSLCPVWLPTSVEQGVIGAHCGDLRGQ
jgi:hypothetical protein